MSRSTYWCPNRCGKSVRSTFKYLRVGKRAHIKVFSCSRCGREFLKKDLVEMNQKLTRNIGVNESEAFQAQEKT